MTSMRRVDLRLLRRAQPPCVSLTAHPPPLAVEMPQNSTRLKYLLRRLRRA
jgi:hypothetical protein